MEGYLMCDTLVALSDVTKDNSVIFGKNSDREPNEPQVMIRIPPRKRDRNEKNKCTYIEVDGEEFTNDVILIKPHWIWGAEMGINSKGLVIGNEAVFTKEKLKPKALLGMDMLRLALEYCDTAAKAVEYIIYLLEQYGQGGKAGYTQNLRYHNSFIIADFKSAYVLETAGQNWVVKQIDDIYTISNSLTLNKDFDEYSSGLIDNAINRGWCKSEEDFNFKACYEDKLYSFATKGDYRQKYTLDSLRKNVGNIDVSYMMSILRSHCGDDKVRNYRSGSMKSICMHGGGIISSQTTGSMVAQLKDGNITLWCTGTSLPCLSLYKPYWFIENADIFFTEEKQSEAVEYWKQTELLHRKVLNGEISDLSSFIAKREDIEAQLLKLADQAKFDEDKIEITRLAKQSEQELYKILSDSISKVEKKRLNLNLYYNWYWKKQNNSLNS